MALPAVILAGGRGSRLKLLADYVPKPMWFVPGGSLLDHHIQRLAAGGASLVIVTCSYKADIMTRYIESRYPDCLIVRTAENVDTPLDAILSVADHLHTDFVVVHGDHWFSQNPFENLFAQHIAGELTFLIERQPDSSKKAGYDSRCLMHSASKELHYLTQQRTSPSYDLEDVRTVDGCMVFP